jgi:hypothetical protein
MKVGNMSENTLTCFTNCMIAVKKMGGGGSGNSQESTSIKETGRSQWGS